MHLSPEDQEKLSQSLLDLIDLSTRALVALRKKEHSELETKLNQLGKSITEYVIDAGAEIFPVDPIGVDVWSQEQTKR